MMLRTSATVDNSLTGRTDSIITGPFHTTRWLLLLHQTWLKLHSSITNKTRLDTCPNTANRLG